MDNEEMNDLKSRLEESGYKRAAMTLLHEWLNNARRQMALRSNDRVAIRWYSDIDPTPWEELLVEGN